MINRPRGLREKFSAYKSVALKANRIFDLTIRDFQELWCAACYYCGAKVNGIGIDRVDNEKGYTRENSVACCAMCNYMKRNHQEDIFLQHCRKIVDHRGL